MLSTSENVELTFPALSVAQDKRSGYDITPFQISLKNWKRKLIRMLPKYNLELAHFLCEQNTINNLGGQSI